MVGALYVFVKLNYPNFTRGKIGKDNRYSLSSKKIKMLYFFE